MKPKKSEGSISCGLIEKGLSMVYVPLEGLLDKSCGSVYKLVILASRRALEIAEGHPRLVDMPASMKPSTVALHEINQGKVFCRILKS